jgi:murein DD-endopeptidase MepM/ murein hydrolase activator NlpD
MYGRKPIIYTARWFWDYYVGTAGWEEEYPLWVASYTTTPRLPSAWSTWLFWQYTASGSCPGINGSVDLNHFNGSPSDLAELAGEEPATPTPMAQATVLRGPLNIRASVWGPTIRQAQVGDVLNVYDVAGRDAWAQVDGGWACIETGGTRYLELGEAEPSVIFAIDAPIGTPEERATGKFWPGNWVVSLGYLAGGTHTGVDLNLNKPTWDSDAHAPVYSIADGVVTYAATVPAPSTWGGVVVIRHTVGDLVFYSRYGHVENILVNVGDEVYRGQHIANIGQYQGGDHNYHLHFDNADETLAGDPLNWPGNNPAMILAHYNDPRQFILAHREAA